MANVVRKITLVSSAGGSGPNYKVEWSINGINYSESIDCGNISLPSVGSFVTCSVPDNASLLRLTSLNIFCSNSVSESIIPDYPCNTAFYTIIESGLGTNTYSYTDAFGIIQTGSLGQYQSIMVGATTASISITGTHSTVIRSTIDYCTQSFECDTCSELIVTNSGQVGFTFNRDVALFYIPCSSSSLDYVLYKGAPDTSSPLPSSGSVCACINLYQFITGSATASLTVGDGCGITPTPPTPPPPITGSYLVEFNIDNRTSASMDSASLQFSFVDVPNNRPSGSTGYHLYITASNIPVGKSTYKTIANFTSAFDANTCCLLATADPDLGSSVVRYIFSASADTGSIPLYSASAQDDDWTNSFVLYPRFNPLTWATMSYDLTASLTSSAPEPPTSSYCYTLETVQSAPGECFDCPGFFASTTDTIMKIFTECSGSEIFPPFDINVEVRYSDNSTSSLFIPTGYTESIIIATSDVQCAPLPACGEIASPTFLSASIVPVSGSIVECCV